jgi:hypothetical protein
MKGYERLRHLFSGWDSVEIVHHDGPGVTVVRLTLTDQNFHANVARNTPRPFQAIPLSSRYAEQLLKHRDGQMRFYGCGVSSCGTRRSRKSYR